MLNTLSGLWRRDRRDTGPEADEIKVLTDQFYLTLRGQISGVERSAGSSASPELQELKAILDREPGLRSWKDAYEVEQKLVHLIDDETVTRIFSSTRGQALHRS